MDNRTLEACLEMLDAMPSGRDQDAKWAQLRKLYVLALTRMQPTDAKSAVKWAVLNEQWRPAPAKLLDIAAELASPIPDAEAAYAEIVRNIQVEGLYARPHPERPSIKLEGPPPFSHPVVEKVVHYCGGWPMLCGGDANFSEGVKKQVRSAHETLAREWREKVKAQLVLAPQQRDRKLFPKWYPYQLPDAQVLAIEAPWEDWKNLTIADMPKEVRKQIACIADRMDLPLATMPGRIPGKSRISRPDDLTPERRAEIATELAAIAERNGDATDQSAA